MDETKYRTLKYGTAIRKLAIIALLCTALSCITYFVYYVWDYTDDYDFYKLTVECPAFNDLLSLFLCISPSVLLVAYILRFYDRFRATIIVPIIFGLVATMSLCDLIKYRYDAPLRCLLLLLTFVLATISALKGFPNKVYLIIAIVVGLFVEFTFLIDYFLDIKMYVADGMYLYLVTRPLSVAGTTTFYSALLLLCSKNKIPAVINNDKKKKDGENNPELELKMLKERFDSRMITEEEYQTKRAEIIGNL